MRKTRAAPMLTANSRMTPLNKRLPQRRQIEDEEQVGNRAQA